MPVDHKAKLMSVIGKSIAGWALRDVNAGHLFLVDTVPPELCSTLVEQITFEISSMNEKRSESGRQASDIEVFEFCPGKILKELAETQLNEERATDKRNSGKSVLIVSPPGPSFPSIGSTFTSLQYQEAVRLASNVLYESMDGSRRELVDRFGIASWLGEVGAVIEYSEGWAYLLSMIADGSDSANVGRELWRVGLIPDVGQDEIGDFTHRIQRNRDIVKSVSSVVKGKRIDARLSAVRVGLTPITKRVIAVLETQMLANPAGNNGWCRSLVGSGKDETNSFGDQLTLDKWDLSPETGDLESLKIRPFRDLSGKVRRACKLKQDEPQTFSENLFVNLEFDQQGEIKRPPSVVVEWDTEPVGSNFEGKWRVSLVRPKAYRNVDEPPFVTRNVRQSLRKSQLKLDLTLEDLPDDVVDSSILVAIEVAAVGDEDGLVLRLTSGDEAIDESEEFELRFESVGDSLGTIPSVDDSVSPAAAILGVSIDKVAAPFRVNYAMREEKSTLEIQFSDLNDEDGSIEAIRSVRIVPTLLRMQRSLLLDTVKATHIECQMQSSDLINIESNLVSSSNLPERLLNARSEFFAEVLKGSKTQGSPSVETLEWESDACAALDRYVAEYIQALEGCVGAAADELQLLDSVQVTIRGLKKQLDTVIVLPTHPLRALWLRTYWEKLSGWTKKVLEVDQTQRVSAVDMGLVNRILPSNLPFVLKSKNSGFQVYASEIAFGYGLYVNPMEPDHESMVTVTIESLGGIRSRALQLNRLASLKRNFDHYVDRRRHPDALAVNTLNTGDGGIVADLLGRYFAEETDTTLARSDFRLEVTAYSDGDWMRRPASKLIDLQARLKDISRAGLSHLSPLIGLAIRSRDKLTSDANSVHLSIIQGIATGKIALGDEHFDRMAQLDGLITGTTTSANTENKTWHVVPNGGSRKDSILSAVHAALLAAQSRQLPGRGNAFGLSVQLTPETAADIRALHERSDRVAILDRYVGLDWFIRSKQLGLGHSYVLDYTPDFVEGLADRLIVTTQHPSEADRLVERAMREMGLETDRRRSQVVENLNLISGRLVLKLMSDNPQAHETVGLAALIAVLRNEGSLKEWFIIPVDSHLEIFGAQGGNDEARRRCDILLVRLSELAIEIRCIEVKERRLLPISDQLRRRIQDQLSSTEEILKERYFDDSLARVDRELQIAHLTSILHHYIERAADHGLLSEVQVLEYHKFAERVGALNCEIRKEAFVVSIESQPHPEEMFGDVRIRFLTAEDLESTSFSTKAEISRRTTKPAVLLESISGDLRNEVIEVDGKSIENFLTDQDLVIDKTEVHMVDSAEADTDGIRKSKEESVPTQADLDDVKNTKGSQINDGDLPDIVPHLGPAGSGVLSKSTTESGIRTVSVQLGTDLAGQAVNWNVSTKGSPHAFVLGITGQGKSVTTRHVISTFAEQGLPSLVIDLHGDMAASPPIGASVLDVRTDGLGFSPFYLSGHSVADISESAYEIAEVFAYVCDLGEMQLANVFKAIKNAYAAVGWQNGEKGSRLPTIEEFAEHVEVVEKGARGKNARERLLPLTDFGLFQENSKAFDPRGVGGGLVVDLHKFKLEQVIRAATSLILRKVYREMFLWPQDSSLKLAIILDEAHRMAQDPTLPKLLKEGRKYGVACFVASQSISDFDDDVKNNSGTKIVFRTNYPESKDVAGLIRGAEKVDFAKQIEQLRVGEAFVSTADFGRARKCKMIAREF